MLTLAEREVDAREEPGAEEAKADAFDLGIVDVEDVARVKRDVAEHYAIAGARIAADLDALK